VRLLASLQLHGYVLAGSLVLQHLDPVWVIDAQMHNPVWLPALSGEVRTLTAEDLHAVILTVNRLAEYNLTQPGSPHDLALRRFATGTARPDAADALLDFTIALEALLLPYDAETRRGELSYRFRMHGAHYIADEAGQRREVLRKLTKIYGTRSGLVHGGSYPDAAAITAARDDARDLAARGLLHAVHHGFPSAEFFNRMMLGEPGD
jgi:hypothetical protein